jgi:two-component system NarL family sensor kinase
VMQRLGRDLAGASPDEVPALVASRTRAGLRLPWVGLELDREGELVPVAEDGVRHDRPVDAFELRHAGSRVGRLLVQPRRGQAGLDRRDRRALAQVAVDVSPSVSATRLVDELTESRERLVAGREAERAWLRRELHDGLGPSLAGMSLALGAARRKLGAVPDDAHRLLANVQDEATRAWQVVRGLLSDLRPPGLEELGLVGALEDRARALDRPDDFTVELVVGLLPALPAAVEVAAYRITTEAMTNAARHSAGHRCRVEMHADGQLDIVVTDDGRGIANLPGIGMRSMAERAEDLGGWVHVAPGTERGTVVEARLPLAVTP